MRSGERRRAGAAAAKIKGRGGCKKRRKLVFFDIVDGFFQTTKGANLRNGCRNFAPLE